MALKELDQLLTEIDTAVHTNGPNGKTTAAGLGTVLKSLAVELTTQEQEATAAIAQKADLDAGGRVPSTQLPSYVDDIVEAASLAALPEAGEAGKVYVALDTNKQYRWSGSAYALLSDSGLTAAAKDALEASRNPSASNAFVTQAEVALSSNRYADIVGLTRTRTYYDNITDAIVASQAGDTINLYAPIFASPIQGGEAFIDLKPGVNINVYGVKLMSASTGHDIITFRGGKSIVNGYHSTITQNTSANGGGWFIGTYGGLPVDVDATINDLHLDLVTYNSVGFALYGNGTYRYTGNITSAGRYIVKMASNKPTASFQGEGSIYQTGSGYIFWIFNEAKLEWRGDITAKDSSTILFESGTITLREGTLHAHERTVGAEKVVTRNSTSSTLILENYSVLGVPGATVIEADTVILRGSTVVVGNIQATSLIDERPAQAAPSVNFAETDFKLTTVGGLQQVTIQESRIKEMLVNLGVLPGGTDGGTPQAGNLLTSTALDDANAWDVSELLPMVAAQPNYSGSNVAYLVRPNTQYTDNHSFRNRVLVAVEDEQQYMATLRVKNAGLKTLSLIVFNSDYNLISRAAFDLITHTKIGENMNASVVALGGDWYEYRFVFKPRGGANVRLFPALWGEAEDQPYAGDGTIGVYVDNPSIIKL